MSPSVSNSKTAHGKSQNGVSLMERCRFQGMKVPFSRDEGAVSLGGRCRFLGIGAPVPNNKHARA